MVKRTHGENGIRSEEWGCEKRTKTMQTQRFAKKLYFYRNLFRNRLTKSRRDDKIYRQSAVAVKIESGRVPEWPMGTDCKSAAFQLRWFESTRAHQKSFSVTTTLELFVLYVHETHECGRIRTASARRTVRRAKNPQWGFFRCAARESTRAHQKSFNVTTTLELFVLCVRETHKCGRIRTASARRTVRRAKKPQWGFFRCAARDIHPRPPRDPVSEPGTGFSVLWKLFQGRAERRQM